MDVRIEGHQAKQGHHQLRIYVRPLEHSYKRLLRFHRHAAARSGTAEFGHARIGTERALHPSVRRRLEFHKSRIHLLE